MEFEMKLLRLPRNCIRLLMEIAEKGKVTTRSQTIYSPFAFYLNKGELEKYGLITCDGVDKNRRNEWILTKKGKTIAEHLKIIEEAFAS